MKRFYKEFKLPLLHAINGFLMFCAAYILYEDYERVGHFQWANPTLVAKGGEIGLNIFAVILLILGIVYILEAFVSKLQEKANNHFYKIVQIVIKILLYCYAAMLIVGSFVSIVGFFILLFVVKPYDAEILKMVLIFLLISGILFFFAYEVAMLVLKNETSKKIQKFKPLGKP